jgi:hypothetical protein
MILKPKSHVVDGLSCPSATPCSDVGQIHFPGVISWASAKTALKSPDIRLLAVISVRRSQSIVCWWIDASSLMICSRLLLDFEILMLSQDNRAHTKSLLFRLFTISCKTVVRRIVRRRWASCRRPPKDGSQSFWCAPGFPPATRALPQGPLARLGFVYWAFCDAAPFGGLSLLSRRVHISDSTGAREGNRTRPPS